MIVIMNIRHHSLIHHSMPPYFTDSIHRSQWRQGGFSLLFECWVSLSCSFNFWYQEVGQHHSLNTMATRGGRRILNILNDWMSNVLKLDWVPPTGQLEELVLPSGYISGQLLVLTYQLRVCIKRNYWLCCQTSITNIRNLSVLQTQSHE